MGNDKEFTVAELANKVIELTSSKSELKTLPLPSDDPKVRKPDLSKTSERFDWRPQVPLEEGLKHTIPYFEKVIQSQR